MYIIENGKAYLVDGEVAYLVNFDTTGKIIINKEETIETANKIIYSYNEMYAKLNIAYMIEEKKKENATDSIENEEIEKLNSKIIELTKENDELKAKLEELKTKEFPKIEYNSSKEEKNNKKNK